MTPFQLGPLKEQYTQFGTHMSSEVPTSIQAILSGGRWAETDNRQASHKQPSYRREAFYRPRWCSNRMFYALLPSLALKSPTGRSITLASAQITYLALYHPRWRSKHLQCLIVLTVVTYLYNDLSSIQYCIAMS
ncbi:hypothetical protein VNO78_10764 [Psophocarpus tetragonolobus]|uniref:Uncharacterized protein n=1 Tax=Psophocarpus tetragonolobus TaxID=3891 RepID=A0AAN9XN16_PSOTE